MKPAHQLRREWNRLDLREFMGAQRRFGRHYLPQDFAAEWSAHYRLSQQVTNDDSYHREIRERARLLREITYFVGTVRVGDRPDYYQYTDGRLLDWYLASDSHTVDGIKSGALCGLFVLVDDLLRFEIQTFNGAEPNHRQHIDPAAIENRIPLAKALLLRLQQAGVTDAQTYAVAFRSLEEYVKAPSRLPVLRHLMCAPLTHNHDEVLFIRVLQGSELCFLGIRATVMSAIESLKFGAMPEALQRLGEAIEFAQILKQLLRLLRTMPVAHFAGFREITGSASALQSIGFHLMDVMLNGVNTDKIMQLKRVPHLRPVIRFCDKRFVSLKQILMQDHGTSSDWEEIVSACRILDKELLTWRGLHVSFARLYIPHGAMGTGGTEGAAYLREHLFRGLFNDQEPDWQAVQEMFPDTEFRDPKERVRCGVMVVP
jgi:tryptophan 2,3-dioxygenase